MLNCGTRKYSHVSGLIRDRLHWLPAPQRIRFKLCLTAYKVMNSLAPELYDSVNANSRTRASARGDLAVRRTRTKFSDRAFVVAGPKASNSLPCNIGNSPSINSFTSASKTLFTVQCWWLTVTTVLYVTLYVYTYILRLEQSHWL